jgi:hypothetical protein
VSYRMAAVVFIAPALAFALGCTSAQPVRFAFVGPNHETVELRGPKPQETFAVHPDIPIIGAWGDDRYEFRGKVYLNQTYIGDIKAVNVAPAEVLSFDGQLVLACIGPQPNMTHFVKYYRLSDKGVDLLSKDVRGVPIDFLLKQEYQQRKNQLQLWGNRILKHLADREDDAVTECLIRFGQDDPGWFFNWEENLSTLIPDMFVGMLARNAKDKWASIM